MKKFILLVFVITVSFSCKKENNNDDSSSGGACSGEILLENTLVIDYNLSNTTESGQLEFVDENYLCEMINESTIYFGSQNDGGSYLAFTPNGELLTEAKVYQLGNEPNQAGMFIQINPLSDGGLIYNANPTGTVAVTFIEYCPEYGGEIHLELTNVRLEYGDYHINVSGTIKGRWD